ncbi:MAG: nucleotidyltransferase domain-containing protein [Gemmatimonadales bacterium]|jgi:predicted nucleotidyltransferase
MPRRSLSPIPRVAGPLRAPLAYALGTPAKVAMLRLLAAGGEPISQREAARRARIQVRSAQRALDDLVALGLVSRLVGGRDHLVRVNRDHRLAGALVEVFQREADLFRLLREALHAVAAGERPRPLSVVLFGSAARGEDRLASDLDVLAVGRDADETAAVLDRLVAAGPRLRAAFGSELRPVAVTLHEVRRAWRRPGSLVRRAAAEAVGVYGAALSELAGR